MSVAENKKIVQRYHTELWAGNLVVVDELLSTEYHSSFGRPQEVKTNISWWLSVFPDSKLTIQELIAEGDKVVMRWEMSGTNIGPDRASNGMLMPPTGQPFVYTGITINQLLNGKIVADIYENGWTNMLIKLGRIITE
jgi:predicted ester cyclase